MIAVHKIAVEPWAPFGTRELYDVAKDVLDRHPNWLKDRETPEDARATAELQAANGRACGECTLCCKLMHIEEIDKPQGHWCQHCDPKRGCRIYAERPLTCQVFLCSWALGQGPAEMKPSRSHVVFNHDAKLGVVRVNVDPQHADAWRSGPVAEHIRLLHAMGHRIVVLIQNKQMPCPTFGIPAMGEGPFDIMNPDTGEVWCHARIENLP